MNRPLTGKAGRVCAVLTKALLSLCVLVVLLGIILFTLGPQAHWMVFVAHGCPQPPKNYTGTWLTWDLNGRMIAKEQYSQGKLDGRSIHWVPERLRRAESSYRNGVLHGPWKNFYDDGSVHKDFEFADGKRSGHWISFYQDGRTNYECFHLRPGAIDGPEILGNTNGDRKVLRTWRDGSPWDGRFWSVSNGDSILRIYDNGQFMSETNLGPSRPPAYPSGRSRPVKTGTP